MTHKHYYLAQSYMGLNYTWDSPCWTLTAYDSKEERDAAADADQNSMGISRRVACKLSPWLRDHSPHDRQDGYYESNNGREVYHA